MKSVIGSLIVALLLAVAGGVCWKLGRSERDLANLHSDVATLRFAVAADRAAGLRSPDDGATANYWLGRYDRVSNERGADGAAVTPDAQERLLSSNAAYRMAQAESVDRPTALKHLEDVIKDYAEVLKAAPDTTDAAYNYEFVIRARNALARAAG